jgi:ATP-dependent DNA ligase
LTLMGLPLQSPIEPQLARGKPELPSGDQWAYEQKYDGFRAIAFVDGDSVLLKSRGSKPLERYFPELRFPPGRYVIDGEIVIDSTAGIDGEPEDFGALQQRIHPAESRIKLLAEQTPARYVAFDVLAIDDEVVMDEPLRRRLERLTELLAGERFAGSSVSQATVVFSETEAEPWLGNSEGVVAKNLDSAYLPGKRTAMVKVKRLRTLDAVVAGYRPGKAAGTVGSLILAVYDNDGALRVIGHSSGLSAAEKKSLLERLRPYESGETGSAEPSRWKADKELEWVALRPELVVEVSFDQVSGGRIRHGTRILRWREDKAPSECLFTQLTE